MQDAFRVHECKYSPGFGSAIVIVAPWQPREDEQSKLTRLVPDDTPAERNIAPIVHVDVFTILRRANETTLRIRTIMYEPPNAALVVENVDLEAIVLEGALEWLETQRNAQIGAPALVLDPVPETRLRQLWLRNECHDALLRVQTHVHRWKSCPALYEFIDDLRGYRNTIEEQQLSPEA